MLCENCKKNLAVVRVQEYNGNGYSEKNLCLECANLEGYPNSLSFQHMFQNLFNTTPTTSILRCKGCGLTYNELKNEGKLGCHLCYETFENVINQSLKNIHGSLEHTGKIPEKTGTALKKKKEIQTLKKNLALAIEKEEYEEAARLRDLIKAINGGGENV